jgi:hypothetical protein
MDCNRSTNTQNRRKARGKGGELAAWLEHNKPAIVGEREWDELKTQLAPVSESYLRRLLRDSGVALAPLVEGVRQESLDELEASLVKLLDEYEQGNRERRARVREAVILAKDHARWTLRRQGITERKEAEKREMILWMTTWLENPPLFREWAPLRRAACREQAVM